MKKFLVLFLSFLISAGMFCDAAGCNIASVLNDSGIDKSSVSISIKDLTNGKTVYELNQKMLMHPASVQKLLTLIPAYEVLGKEYSFKTSILKRDENSYVIKLGADPYLTSSELRKLSANISKNTTRIYIDDSIVEKKDWGEGWQWDDDLNVLMPRFNSYNMDGNVIKITVMPTNKGELAQIINPSKYPLVFLNNVVTEDVNQVNISRDSSVSSNTLSLNGTVTRPMILTIPTNNLKRYFDITLTNILSDKNIYLKENFTTSLIKESDIEVDKIAHPISLAVNDILKNSNNMVSETISKLAAEVAYADKGTDLNAIKLFNTYCSNNKLDNSRIKLADASGVSKNNLVTSDFITEFLVLNKNNEVLNFMATPGEGTLTHRMLPLKENLRAKTGTLSDISSIAGFLITRTGHKLAFCIIINDPSSTSSDKKTLEDYILREVYLKM